MTPKQISISLQSGIETGNRSAAVYVSTERYTQHNPAIGDGIESIIAFLDTLPSHGLRARPLRSIQDGALTAVHVDYDLFGAKAGFDIHRFEDGLIVEHWDNFEPVLASPNSSGRSMFDGPVDNGDPARTDRSKAIVRDFVERVAISNDWDRAWSFFDGERLAQHHPGFGDGVRPYLTHLGYGQRSASSATYETLHMVIGEGELVLAVSEGDLAGRPTAFYDLFRLAGDALAELWTVAQAIPPTSEWKNPNGKF